jgi:hypothetical protein
MVKLLAGLPVGERPTPSHETADLGDTVPALRLHISAVPTDQLDAMLDA